MKKFFIGAFLLCSIFPQVLHANSGMCNINDYAIVYINGMLNSYSDAERGRRQLEMMLDYFNIENAIGGKLVVYKAYNPSHAGGVGDSIRVLLQKFVDELNKASSLDYDAENMLRDLSKNVKEGKILFVPHSQGNFYANSLYKYIVGHKHGLLYTSLTMYNVASPAEVSAFNSAYLLSASDQVIAGLVGSVGAIRYPNITFGIPEDHPDQLGHNFVDTYLALGSDRMMEDIKSQLSILKRDIKKNPEEPCIPAPEKGVFDTMQSVQYGIVDATAFVIKTALSLTVKSVAFVASAFTTDTKEAPVNNHSPVILPPAQINPPDDTLEVSTVIPDTILSTLQELPLTLHVKKEEPQSEDPDIIRLYTERVSFLEQMLQETQYANTLVQNTLADVRLTPSSSSHSRSHHHSEDSLSKETTYLASSSPPEQLPNTSGALASNTASTTPADDTEAESPSIEVAPFAVRAVSLPQGAQVTTAQHGNLLITEYYIGTEGERSWVEIMNTHKEYWVDTSSVVVDIDNTPVPFPTTLIPPWSTVILYSNGFAQHHVDSSHPPYAVSRALQPLSRFVEGDVRIFERLVGGDEFLDSMHYGGEYCSSAYAYTRSCERLVMQYPGNAPEYWTRSIDISLPTRNDYVSSYGKENHVWKYRIFEGQNILEMYTGEVASIQRDRAPYISGQITIAAGEELKIDHTKEWVLVPSVSYVYESGNNTELSVYGTLRVWRAGNLRAAGYAEPHVVAYLGGTIIRDPYAFLSAPTLVRGGKMRTNAIDFVQIEEGDLYLTNYQDATLQEAVSCDSIRSERYRSHWIGGSIYVEGIHCGHRELTDGGGLWIDYGTYDAFGVLFGDDAEGCSAFVLNDSGTFSCQDENGPPEPEDPPGGTSSGDEGAPPEDVGNATTTDSTPIDYVSLGLTSEGCFDGTHADATISAQQASTCGNGWAPRPTLFPLPEMTVQRSPREGRMQIVEYYIGATGSAPWIKIGNMMGGAYINMYNSDYRIGDARKPIPVLSIPKRSHIVIVGEGEFDPAVLPGQEEIGGTMSTLFYIDRTGIAGDWNEKVLDVLNAPSPRDETVQIETLTLSKDVCDGTVTSYGSCLLHRRALFWNDPYEGVL